MPQKYFQISIVAAVSPVPGMWIVPADMSLRKTDMFKSDLRQLITFYFPCQWQQKQVHFVKGKKCCGLPPHSNEMCAFSKGHFCDLQIPAKAETRIKQASQPSRVQNLRKNSLAESHKCQPCSCVSLRVSTTWKLASKTPFKLPSTST